MPTAKVGPPPVSLTPAQRESWLELAPQVARVYTPSDRASFTLLVKLYALVEAPAKKMPPYVYASLVARVATLLESFGCSPRSRRQVDVPESSEPDAEEAFLFPSKTRGPPTSESAPKKLH